MVESWEGELGLKGERKTETDNVHGYKDINKSDRVDIYSVYICVYVLTVSAITARCSRSTIESGFAIFAGYTVVAASAWQTIQSRLARYACQPPRQWTCITSFLSLSLAVSHYYSAWPRSALSSQICRETFSRRFSRWNRGINWMFIIRARLSLERWWNISDDYCLIARAYTKCDFSDDIIMYQLSR